MVILVHKGNVDVLYYDK